MQQPTPSPDPSTESGISIGALLVRGALFVLMAGLIAQMILANRQQPAQPGELFISGQPGGAVGQHTEDLRSRDAATSGTAILREYEKTVTATGGIGFDILRQTQLYADPPPIYPEELSRLDGRKVRMAGFMSPYDSLNDMRKFMLFPHATGCYFCAPPSPLEVVFIRWDTDRRQQFIEEPILVEGILRLWTEGSTEEKHRYFLYVIDEAKVTKLGDGQLEDLLSR